MCACVLCFYGSLCLTALFQHGWPHGIPVAESDQLKVGEPHKPWKPGDLWRIPGLGCVQVWGSFRLNQPLEEI